MNKDCMSFGRAKWIAYIPDKAELNPQKPWNPPASETDLMKKRGDYLATLGWPLPAGEYDQHESIEDTAGIALFSTTVNVNGIKSATLDSTALGVYDLLINGRRVGRRQNGEIKYDEMKPGWTDYTKRVLYYSYDITEYLHNGENTILAAVSSGWWNGHISLGTYGENHVAFCAALHILDNGGARTVVTDESWRGAWGSAVRAADIWDGELYDARFPSLSLLSSDPGLIAWDSVTTEAHDISITPHTGPTVTVRSHLTRKPKTVTVYDRADANDSDFGKIHVCAAYKNEDSFTLAKGEKAVVDFGQNHTGVPSFNIRAPRGTTVRLRTGEMLNDCGLITHGNDGPAGSVFSSNLRGAKSKAYYIASGETDGEQYRPTFTFFGYRYLEICATDTVEVGGLRSVVIGSDIRETGRIETSDADVNRLIQNIIWGQRSNYLSVPTDCPQRDERLGWTGDTQAFSCTAAYNGDVYGFLRKWLADARDSQSDEGPYPDCIPRTRIFGEGAAGWGDAGIIVPYVLWRMYGDTEVIREHFASMEKYMDWLSTRGFDGPKAVYCDWLSVEDTDGAFISVVYYALDAGYLSEMARAIGRDDRADYYAALKEEIAVRFREKYCDADGNLTGECSSQTCCLLALKHGLLLPKNRGNAILRLKNSIVSRGYHLSTGFIGTSIINDVLAEIGENNLAYSLLMQTEMPSWLYCVRKGATTVWERWDSFTDEHGFVVYGVDSSFNHYSYGALGEWLYRHVAGISSDEPGFAHPVFAPKPDTRTPDEIPAGQNRLTWVKAEYDSPSAGMIKSEWSTESGFVYRITAPCASKVILPRLTGSDTFTLNGISHRFDEYPCGSGDSIVLEVGAGEYEFTE